MSSRIPTVRPPANRNLRPTNAQRGYDAEWQRLRKYKLATQPLCEDCKEAGRDALAEHVDHVDGNTGNRRWANLRSLCAKCHGRKSYRHDGAFGRAVNRKSEECRG